MSNVIDESKLILWAKTELDAACSKYDKAVKENDELDIEYWLGKKDMIQDMLYDIQVGNIK